MTERSERTLRVALGEYDLGWEDPAASVERAAEVVSRAAAAGAELVVLPETCTTGFTMDTRWAEPLEGPHVRALRDVARDARVWLLAGVVLREARDDVPGETCARNAALLVGPDGALEPLYRKRRLFPLSGEHEAFVPGDAPAVARVGRGDVRVSPFICYDLRFPELFREVARDVDLMVLIANWPASRRAHWDTLARARAIENQCYFVAVNRTGAGGGVHYDGGSVALDPRGEAIAPVEGTGARGVPACVDIRPAVVAEVREKFPFLEGLAEREAATSGGQGG